MRPVLITPLLLLLSGCATTSFAPPQVAVEYDKEGDVSALCKPGGSRPTTVPVTRTVDGAYRLVDTFIETYRCAAHSAANGRQAFEIPAFLATTGAALASAVGGGATYGIVGTAANATFNAGGKYWDPKLKAGLYDHALDALLCVKTEAVGIPAYKFDQAETEAATTRTALVLDKSPSPGVEVSVQKQYFEMVSSAVFSVERILAYRLNNMASVDASAVSAELAKAIEEVRKKEEERKKKLGGGDSGSGSGTDEGTNTVEAAMFARQLDETPKQAMVSLDLSVLKPKLDECVVRAKL